MSKREKIPRPMVGLDGVYSYEKAQANAKEAIHLWIDTAKEFGDPVPTPKGQRLMLA